MNRAVPRYGILLLTTALLAFTSIASGAASVRKVVARQSTGKTIKSHARKSPHTTGAAMRIFKDPETGLVGPPTAENARLLARETPVEINREALPTFKLANGGVGIVTDQIEDAVVAKIGANGKPVFICTTNPKAALKNPAPAAPAQREDR